MKTLHLICLSIALLAGCHKPANPETELETMTRKVSSEFSGMLQEPLRTYR